jgi:hypothetical protein
MSGIKSMREYALYERVAMRILFAWVVLKATPARLSFYEIPAPNGIARLLNLHFLLDPRVYAFCRVLLVVALVLYVLRLMIWLALPLALLVNVAANAVTNSQGAIQHAYQIVSLVLLAQTAAHFYGLWLRCTGEPRAFLEDRLICWSQQTIVAVYFVAGITKLIVTKGLWIFQAQMISVSMAKAAYGSFYERLDHADLEQKLAMANFAAAHGWVVALIAGCGLALELGSPLMLLNRSMAALFGCALLAFHLGLDRTMHLSFIFNQWLLIIYMINIPYWIVTGARAMNRNKKAVLAWKCWHKKPEGQIKVQP